MPNQKADGRSFTPQEIEQIWRRAIHFSGYGPTERKIDACGYLIMREKFGDTISPYGWAIDHIRPLTRGGSDEIENLQPLHWENNLKKGDRYPWFTWNC